MSSRAPDDRDAPRRRRGAWGWLAVLVGLLLVAGLGLAIVASQDDTVAGAVSETVDEGADTVTSAGDEAADTVTSAADDAVDDVTGADAQSASPVESDPVVKRLAQGRDLPFTAGPWVRAAYRDTVYGRLRPATLTIARKVRAGQGYAIRFG